MFNEYKDILSVKELCTALHICQTTAYKLLREKNKKYTNRENL